MPGKIEGEADRQKRPRPARKSDKQSTGKAGIFSLFNDWFGPAGHID
jgi:hypothetical protein